MKKNCSKREKQIKMIFFLGDSNFNIWHNDDDDDDLK